MHYDFKDAWNVAHLRKKRSNLARCYIEAVAMVTKDHRHRLKGGECSCVVCEVFADERPSAAAVPKERA